MRTIIALLAVLSLGTALAVGGAAAQHPHGGPAHGEAAGVGAAHHAAGHLEAVRCTEASDRAIAEGRGFGMVFVADQSGYPGPLHLLELRQSLHLSPEQERGVEALWSAMLAEARPRGAAVLQAEAALRALFESGGADEGRVQAQVRAIERLRADLRLTHLSYHLKTRELLTAEQRAVYHAARWGAAR